MMRNAFMVLERIVDISPFDYFGSTDVTTDPEFRAMAASAYSMFQTLARVLLGISSVWAVVKYAVASPADKTRKSIISIVGWKCVAAFCIGAFIEILNLAFSVLDSFISSLPV